MRLQTGITKHLDSDEFSDWLKLGNPRSSLVYAYGDLAASVKRSDSAELRAVAEIAWAASLAGLCFLSQRRDGIDANNLGLFEYVATKAAGPHTTVGRVREAA
jgi:hypothetical protein